LHEVEITEPFYLGREEVTQEQYEAVMKEKPSGFRGAKLPVEHVLWIEAKVFADAVTKEVGSGLVFRLPMEAEWEYSCRGGRPSSQPFGIDTGRSLWSSEANFDGNYPYGVVKKGEFLRKTTEAGVYRPNALGIYDMHGNVSEWCL